MFGKGVQSRLDAMHDNRLVAKAHGRIDKHRQQGDMVHVRMAQENVVNFA